MMKLLIRALVLTGVILGFSYGSSWGTPAIPENATLESQEVGQCGSGVILRYLYTLPNGETVVIFKEPNKEPTIYLRWNAGNSGDADEVWVLNKKITIQELYTLYPDPCAVFNSIKT